MGKRRRAREVALGLLYQQEFHAAPAGGVGTVWGEANVPPEVRLAAEALVRGVSEHRAEIDAALAAHAEHWSLTRMAVVDRNILRLGVYELLCRDDVPEGAVINEAIELAKTFGTEDSPRFVNGILDRIRALVRPAPAP